MSQNEWRIMMVLSKKHDSYYCCPIATLYWEIFKCTNGGNEQ